MSTLSASTVNIKSSIKVPVYTTTQRNSLSPVQGTLIYNSTDQQLQFFSNTGWKVITYF